MGNAHGRSTATLVMPGTIEGGWGGLPMRSVERGVGVFDIPETGHGRGQGGAYSIVAGGVHNPIGNGT